MSLAGYGEQDSGSDVSGRAAIEIAPNASFRFVPKELSVKCRKLLESHHGMHGYACLPDMLWQSDARDIIERHRSLMTIFKTASKSRCAKRANESFLFIATVVVSLDVLARDFAGWGKRYPAAKREADLLLSEILHRQNDCLLNMYMYPAPGNRRELVSVLVQSPGDRAAL
jgi:hypothetical protein